MDGVVQAMSKLNGVDPKSVPANMMQPAEMAVLMYGAKVPEEIATAVVKELELYKDAFGVDNFNRRAKAFMEKCKGKHPPHEPAGAAESKSEKDDEYEVTEGGPVASDQHVSDGEDDEQSGIPPKVTIEDLEHSHFEKLDTVDGLLRPGSLASGMASIASGLSEELRTVGRSINDHNQCAYRLLEDIFTNSKIPILLELAEDFKRIPENEFTTTPLEKFLGLEHCKPRLLMHHMMNGVLRGVERHQVVGKLTKTLLSITADPKEPYPVGTVADKINELFLALDQMGAPPTQQFLASAFIMAFKNGTKPNKFFASLALKIAAHLKTLMKASKDPRGDPGVFPNLVRWTRDNDKVLGYVPKEEKKEKKASKDGGGGGDLSEVSNYTGTWDASKTICWTCGGEGHRAAVCPKPEGKGKGKGKGGKGGGKGNKGRGKGSDKHDQSDQANSASQVVTGATKKKQKKPASTAAAAAAAEESDECDESDASDESDESCDMSGMVMAYGDDEPAEVTIYKEVSAYRKMLRTFKLKNGKPRYSKTSIDTKVQRYSEEMYATGTI